MWPAHGVGRPHEHGIQFVPLYEFTCDDCQSQVELLVSSASVPKCPDCGGERLTRLLSVIAAPARDSSVGAAADRPGGPCGPSCACHPHR